MRNFAVVMMLLTAAPAFALDLKAERGPTLLVLSADDPAEGVELFRSVSIAAVRPVAYTTEKVGVVFQYDTSFSQPNPPLPTPRPSLVGSGSRTAVDRPARRVSLARPADAGSSKTRPNVYRISSPLSPIIGAFN